MLAQQLCPTLKLLLSEAMHVQRETDAGRMLGEGPFNRERGLERDLEETREEHRT